MRLLFWLRTGSAGLLEDKKRCRMVSDERCVICDSGVGEDVSHFLIGCGEFEGDRLVLLDICRIVGPESGWRECGELWRRERVVMLLGKGVEDKCNRVMEEVGVCACIGWVDGGREGSNWCLGMLLLDIVVLVGRWWQRRK